MKKMTNDAVYWALAREHAPKVFAFEPEEPLAWSQPDPAQARLITKMAGKCAVIAIEGPIFKNAWVLAESGRLILTGYDLIRVAIDQAVANPEVRQVLLSFDSPGGVLAGTKELADHIRECAKAKPMAAYADGLCASAAFWLAAATGRIFAPATALVGSVGVIMTLENWAGRYSRIGLQIEHIASGKFKAAGADGKELTAEERAYFEGQLADLHAIFREDVRAALKIATDDPLWAEAQLLPATQAEKLGLVSKIVADQTAAIRALNQERKEELMDLQTLKAEHPALVEKLRAEISQDLQKESLAEISARQKDFLELAEVALGQAAGEKLRALLESGVNAAQMRALSPLFAKAPASEASAREKALEKIQAATGGALPQAAQSQNRKSPIVADAERRRAGGF